MIKRILGMCTFLILTAVMLSGCSRSESEMQNLAEMDKPAPNFTLRDLGGQEVSLDQFRGKIVLMDFWATWCGPCRMTMPLLERLEKEYSSVMVQLAINQLEPIDEVREYVQSQGVHARVLLDEDGSVSTAYRVGSIPTQFLIDRNGILRHVQLGFSPDMTAELRMEIEKLR